MGQILGWTDATVTPEVGQTTTIEVWNADRTVLLATHDGIEGTSFDIPDTSFGDEAVVFIQLWAERTDANGTFRSLQAHGIWVQVNTFGDTAVGDGVWTWFVDPRAISVAGEAVVAAVTSAGRIMAYDADETPTGVDLRGSLFQVDDHANPSILHRSSDGRILVFASAHNGSGLYTYLSTNPDDPSAFGAETNIDSQLGLSEYTYPCPYQLTDEANEPIYLFFRALSGGSRKYWHSVSTDQGVTWAAATQLLANNGDSTGHSPYVKQVQNGNGRIDFFCTDGHPQFSSTNSIYHFYYEAAQFHETDGTPLTLPIDPGTDLTPLYDGSTIRAWIWDAAIDGSGNPACVFATFPSTADHRYNYAIWDGAAWDVNEICSAGGFVYSGEPYYSGGVTIDPDDVNKVFASRAVDDAHQLYRYETADGGVTWAETQITAEAEKCLRPYVVRGQVSEPRLAYFTGRYTTFTDYDTNVVLMDSTRSPTVETGARAPIGDMQSGSDRRIPAGDMNSGSDIRIWREVSFD